MKGVEMIKEDITNLVFITYTDKELEILRVLPVMCQFLYQKIKESNKLNWYTGEYAYSNYIEWAGNLNKIQILNGYNLQKLKYTRKNVSTIVEILIDTSLIERVAKRKNTLKLLQIKLFEKKDIQIKKMEGKKIYKAKDDGVPKRFNDKNLVL